MRQFLFTLNNMILKSNKKNRFGQRHKRMQNRNGFTLIELLFVIAIIGVLAAIEIPFFRNYMQRGYDSSTVSDLKNAYTAAQIYFGDHPSGALDETDLGQYGFRSTKEVTITVMDGTEDGLTITANHKASSKVYTLDSAGTISEN